ncbi:MAG: GMC family oxidoreductase N-terminal domain-containing protein [Solirubrobacteraceae bacterium]
MQEFARRNTAFAYLDVARARENLTVIGDARVDRVLLDGLRARSRAARDDSVELGADLVIDSAGAFGSPGVLMRSGIGPGDHLAELGITTASDFGGSGRPFGITAASASSSGRARSWSERSGASTQSDGWSAAARSCGRRAGSARTGPGTSTS